MHLICLPVYNLLEYNLNLAASLAHSVERNLFSVLLIFSFCGHQGVYSVRVSEDEWYLLGADSDGPNGATS